MVLFQWLLSWLLQKEERSNFTLTFDLQCRCVLSSAWLLHRCLQAQAYLGIAWVMRTHITRTGHKETWSQAYSICMHRRRYSIQCSDKIRFPQLWIKCGVAKSCPGTHTALQALMATCMNISVCSHFFTFILMVTGLNVSKSFKLVPENR